MRVAGLARANLALRYVVTFNGSQSESWRGAASASVGRARVLALASACKTLGRGARTKLRTHSYARKYAKSTGALKHAARNRYTAGKISGKVCCTQSAATYKPPPSNPAKDK